MSNWTTEYRWEVGKPDDFFVRVWESKGTWSFQFYDWDGEFIEEGEGSGFSNPGFAKQAAQDWYREYVTGKPEGDHANQP